MRHELLQWRIEYPGRPTGQQFFPQDVELAFEGNDFELVGGYSDLWSLLHSKQGTGGSYSRIRSVALPFFKRTPFYGCPAFGDFFYRCDILNGDFKAIAVLRKLLNDRDFRLRRLAAAAIGKAGTAGKEAFGDLHSQAFNSNDMFMRAISRIAMLQIDVENSTALGNLKILLVLKSQPILRINCAGKLSGKVLCDPIGEVIVRFNESQTSAWNLLDGKRIPYISSVSSESICAIGPRGDLIAFVNQDDSSIVLRNVVKGNVRKRLAGQIGGVVGATFSSDGERFASVGIDKKVRVWSVATKDARPTLEVEGDSSVCIRFSTDNNSLAIGGKTLLLLDLRTGKASYFSRKSKNADVVTFRTITFSPDNRLIAAGDDSCELSVWDVYSRNELWRCGSFRSDFEVVSVCFDKQGKLLVSSEGDVLHVIDVANGEELGTIASTGEFISAVLFDETNHLCGVGGDNQCLRVWDMSLCIDDLHCKS